MLHHVVQSLLDGHRDVGLLQKRVVEIHLGDVAENHVEHIRRNLLPRIGQLVEGLVHVVGNHVILHRHGHLHEDVVFGFGLDVERELLHAQIDASGNLVEPRQFEVDAGARHALELAHALHDHGLGGLHLEESAQNSAEHKNSYDQGEQQRQNL